jgi:hypothetical protein
MNLKTISLPWQARPTKGKENIQQNCPSWEIEPQKPFCTYFGCVQGLRKYGKLL